MERETSLEEVLRQVVLDVFEQMYFMFPQEIGMEDALKLGSSAMFVARVRFKNGGLDLMIAGSESLCRNLAENMFGEGAEFSNQDVEDVVREAANIITGNLINESGFPGEVSPDIPVSVEGLDPDKLYQSNELNIFFNVGNELFSAHMNGLGAI